MNELKWSLFKRPGGVLQAVVTSCDKPIDQILDAHGYERKFVRMLEPFQPIARLDLIINSSGGSVNSAFGMMQAVCRLKRPVRVLIDGKCESAASLIATLADKGQTLITPGGTIFVHMPKLYRGKRSGGVWRLFEGQAKLVTVNMMISAYKARLRWPRRAIRQMMKESRRFTAREAVDVGFCDAICERWVFDP